MLQDIPFELRAGAPAFVVVRAEAGAGKPISVLVDSGAATPFDLLVTPHIAARAGGKVGGVLPTRTAAIGQGAITYRGYRLPTFRIGDMEVRNANAGVTNAVGTLAAKTGRPVDVILGQRFLAQRVTAIDYGQRRINFTASAPTGGGTPFIVAPTYPLMLVRVRLNDKGPYLMVLDTGASTSAVGPQVAAEAGMTGGRTVPLAGAGGVAGTARAVRTRVSFAGRTATSSVAVADVLAPLRGSGAPVDGILGADWFAGTRLTIDGPGKQVWVQGAPAAK